MPFPYDPADLAALDRLANFYNGGDYDASTNPGGMGRRGHRVNFENALADAARVGAANAAAATAAGTSATNAGNSATAAAASAAKLIGSSASNVAIGTGSKAFVTQADKFFAPGAFVIIHSAANPTVNYMAGQVTAYSGADLTIDATVTKGSGTFSDWIIAIAGAPGGQGLPGLAGPVGPTPDIFVTFSDGVTDSDPGNGLLKFNNALPGSTTQLFVDNLDRYGTNIAAWLDSFDDSTNTALRGTVKLVQVSDPTKYARFNVVGAVVDGTGYRKIAVAHVLSSGTFSNGAILAIDFVRTGNAGLNGDGAGDVLGPAVSTDGHVALFDGPTGKLLKGGGALAPVATNGLAASVTVTPTGSLGASSVQAALAELDDEKQPVDVTLTALSGAATASFGIARLGDSSAAAQRAALNLMGSGATVGRLARFTDTAGSQGQTSGLRETAGGRVGIGRDPSDYTLEVAGVASVGYTENGRVLLHSSDSVVTGVVGVGTLSGFGDAIGIDAPRASGSIYFGTSSVTQVVISTANGVAFPGIATTAAAANAVLDSGFGNRLLRSTSSLRYKTEVETLESFRADAVIGEARPVWYRSTSEVDNPAWGWYGLIAEEMAEIDPRLVFWRRPTKTVTEEVEDDATEEVVVERQEVVVVDGIAVLRTLTRTETRRIIDELPVTDEAGQPVMVLVTEARPAILDGAGEEIEPAVDAVYTQLVHRQPRKTKRIVEREVADEDAALVPDGVQYDRLTVMLLDVVRRQEGRIAALEAELAQPG